MKLFSADPRVSLNFSKLFFALENIKKKNTSKSCILMAVGWFLFSASPTAQNSPELHFRFNKLFYSTISGRISGRPRSNLNCLPAEILPKMIG